jgi:hypothetical protein
MTYTSADSSNTMKPPNAYTQRGLQPIIQTALSSISVFIKLDAKAGYMNRSRLSLIQPVCRRNLGPIENYPLGDASWSTPLLLFQIVFQLAKKPSKSLLKDILTTFEPYGFRRLTSEREIHPLLQIGYG